MEEIGVNFIVVELILKDKLKNTQFGITKNVYMYGACCLGLGYIIFLLQTIMHAQNLIS